MTGSDTVPAVVLLAIVTAAVVGSFRLISRRGRYRDPESLALASKPVLVLAGALGLLDAAVPATTGAAVFWLGAAFGMLCGALTFGMFLPIRDAALSFVAFVVTAGILVTRFGGGWEVSVALLLHLGALAAGLALSTFRLRLPRVDGAALLGGVALLDFLLSPFGLPLGSAPMSPEAVVVGTACAGALGLLIGLAPKLTVFLATLAVAVLAVALPLFLQTSSALGQPLLVQPEWGQAIGMAGVALGHLVGRAPFAIADRVGRR
ncbi:MULTISPECIES: hypothetical protein [unclassified Rathayibacter]|uniref:hypothetical protein n=1 Tax=unclassified Rathayibacter TaxID=2609250 RepID=UPI0006F5C660|nr:MULTISPECIES: hypothetical protein [unclassified Rathayibacter]KQQ06283.1 hypothetical protein ASF42_07170 [Rathayibacter sp. Leaf294]KQS14138.1 hypothetical protein ASG06_07170 [Rathayibacter sp. Leaf185]